MDITSGMVCKYFKLKGKVQMVHYRNWVVAQSRSYGVKGWVANGGQSSRDGSHAECSTCGAVLGHVEGRSESVDRFLRKVCKGGPPSSFVSSCSVFSAPCFGCHSFYKEYRFCWTWSPWECKARC
mmetsp:Transcript_14762/g.19858  ORF Transcript_14762/g.19858 Transcript_14762/m.19858 type:complete len:125 (+) Transcript_14762:143-517(+)